MTQKTAAPYTTTDLNVPYGQKIAISTNGGGIVTILYQTGPSVSPPGFYVHDRINNEEVLLGTFAADQVVRIETSGSPALYNIGASPTVGVGDADTLKGYSPDATDTAVTIVLRDGSGDIVGNAFESTVTTGTTPMTIASTTKVTNLNADQCDGFNASQTNAADTIVVTDGSGNIVLNNGINLYGKNTGGGNVPLARMNSNTATYGSVSNATEIKSNGTLTHNGTAIMEQNAISDSFTTTDGKTVTVINGRITNIV